MKYVLGNLIVLGCFCVLNAFAYGRAAPSTPMHTVAQRPTAEPDMSPVGGPVILRWNSGYSNAEAKQIGVLLDRFDREKRKRQAAITLAKVYGLTPGNMDADIFGRAK